MKLRSSQYVKSFDWSIIIIITAIVSVSLLMLANANFNPFAEEGQSGLFSILARIDFNYVFLQACWYLLGLGGMMAMLFMDYHAIGRYGKILYFVNCTVLLGLLIFGQVTRGIQGWITLGSRGIQPSELCKITIIIFIGKLIAKKIEEKGETPLDFRDLLPIVAYFAVPLILVMAQPDWGTAMVYVCSFMGMLFMAKINKKVILTGILSVLILAPIAWFFMTGWQRQRIIGFLGGSAVDQVNQSKVLIGSGQILGKGFFKEGTLAQLDFMAEKHTDFIFAFVVETIGFIGGMLIIVLYFALLFRLLYLVKQSGDIYGSIIIVGVLFMFVAHIFENIAMTMGIMPVTGIPAPFLSYGGSSMLANMLAIGLVESVVIRRTKRYFE